MRLVTFKTRADTSAAHAAVGLIDGESIIDLAATDPTLPGTMRGVIAGGEALASRLAGLAALRTAKRLPFKAITLLPVVLDAPKIICVGLNYADHAKEGGNAVSDYPALFMRSNRSMIGAEAPMVRPSCSDTLDYEAELMVIIGRGGRHIVRENALTHVFGYSIFNDGSVREFQRKASQWTPGKNFDDTGAVGPWIVTADELPAGAVGLGIESRLNGKVMQRSTTSNMICPVAETIALVSQYTTLETGDMIAMGTPEGVGYARKPPVFMRPGDVIEVEIEKIGVLRNRIIAEEAVAEAGAAA